MNFEYDEDNIGEENKSRVRGLIGDTIVPALYEDFVYEDEEDSWERLEVLTYLIKSLQAEALELEQAMFEE